MNGIYSFFKIGNTVSKPWGSYIIEEITNVIFASIITHIIIYFKISK